MKLTDEMNSLFARLDDLCELSDKGEVAVSAFLSPRERVGAERHLKAHGARYFCFGGYENAERQKAYILPDYMEGVESVAQLKEYGYSENIACVVVEPSGYRALTHRDYMGSVLGLGVERAVIGDILVYDDGSAVVIGDELICDFLKENLLKVANDKVKVKVALIDTICVPERKFAQILDTVASPRIDCIVAALCSLPREKARVTVEAGLVEVNYEPEERPDRDVTAPSVISVRGYGKYEVMSVCDKTKKGRYRLIAKKYI
ncbi:MAG: hypothetical protein J6U86_02145 [Clostridia bacterium]|nr:hypothetical protein [Clostridia bacterium]